MKNILIFNKISGVYIGLTHGEKDGKEVDEINMSDVYFKYKTIDFDPETHEWFGDYETGELIEIESRPVVTESQLNAQARNKINDAVPHYKQLNMQAALLEQLVLKVHLIADELNKPEFKLDAAIADEAAEMRDYITAIRENNKRYIEFYQSSEDYIFQDKAAEAEHLSKQLEGGLHEVFGKERAGVEAPVVEY